MAKKKLRSRADILKAIEKTANTSEGAAIFLRTDAARLINQRMLLGNVTLGEMSRLSGLSVGKIDMMLHGVPECLVNDLGALFWALDIRGYLVAEQRT